jgi:hypothetical protein
MEPAESRLMFRVDIQWTTQWFERNVCWKEWFWQTSFHVVCTRGQLQFHEGGVGEVCHLATGVRSAVWNNRRWTWVYTKMVYIQVLGFWKYWTQKLASLRSECHAITNKCPEAASVVQQAYRVLCNTKKLDRCTPTKQGGKLWLDLHCEQCGEQNKLVRWEAAF